MRLRHVYYAILGVLAVVGLAAVGYRLAVGMKVTAMTSYISWGFWVAMYIYFIGLSAGSFLLSTMIYVFRMQALERLGRAALLSALGALAAGLFFIWMDLGHPYRFWEIFTRPHFASVMTVESWLYLIYFVLVAFELWLLMRDDLVRAAAAGRRFGSGLCRALTFGYRPASDRRAQELTRARADRWVRVLGMIGIPVAIGVHGGTGSIFAVAVARPYWNGGLFPIVFLVSALASGAALMAFLYAAFGPREREGNAVLRSVATLTALFIGLDLLLLASEVLVGFYSGVPADADVLRAMFQGRYWFVFWIGQLGLAGIVPLLIVSVVANRRQGAGSTPHTHAAARSKAVVAVVVAVVGLFALADVALLGIPATSIPALAGLRSPLPLGHSAGWVFWFGQLAVVCAAVGWLAWGAGSPTLWYGLAGLSTVVGIVAVRLDIVIPGFVMPELSGLATAYVDPRLSYSYFPNVWEFATSIGAIALVVLVFSLLWESLPLFGTETVPAASVEQQA